MMRLVRHGLMFGNLYEVTSPSMVNRYNRALEHLSGKRTALEEFHIDISGFSPEIGDELDDPLYLNPNGCNRQFILLSVEQKTAPLLNARFSTSRTILRRFIDENEEQLFALSIRDPVVGELVNSVYSVEKPRDLFNFSTIEIDADTVGGHAEAGDELSEKIERFINEPDGWWDDVLIAEMVDWARSCGFPVIAAGKGTKYLPSYHELTPDDVWDHYGITAEEAAKGGMNAQMFNSFMDGTKSAIEMAAVANACGLTPARDGLEFPPVSCDELAEVLKPRGEGGVLAHKGQVEVISSLERDGRAIERDLRWGVYVVFEAPTDYARRCFREYGLATDSSGRYAAMYKPYHLIGLELGISVAHAALHGQATGTARDWRGDVVATAKRDLKAGETLDGEGGYTVWGRLCPAADSLSGGYLPLGLAQGVKLARPVAKGKRLTWKDVEIVANDATVACRREMEQRFAAGLGAAAE